MSADTLVVRRIIRASSARLFDAWTDPRQLVSWWGPRDVRCIGADIDLRVGGRYRLSNQLPDGRVVVIAGEFIRVERPVELVYTWQIEPTPVTERVTVQFLAADDATNVVITHERIADVATRREHEHGWCGCLDGLEAHVAPQR